MADGQSKAWALTEGIVALNIPGVEQDYAFSLAGRAIEKGLSQVWQLEALGEEGVDSVVSSQEARLDNLLLKKIVQLAQQPPATDGQQGQEPQEHMGAFAKFVSAQTEVMKSLGKKVKKKDKKRGRSRSSDSSLNVEKEPIDVAAALQKYGMQGINEEHLPAPELIKSAVKKARKWYTTPRNTFIAEGSLARKYAPFWMDKRQMPKTSDAGPEWESFAQFASFWWSRALTQLTAQGANGKQTLSPTTLINAFLDLCRMAQEHKGSGGSAYAYEYDYRLWTKISDQLEKGSKDLDPQRDLDQPNQKVTMQVDARFAKKPAPPNKAGHRDFGGPKDAHERQSQEICSFCGKQGHREEFCFKKMKIKRQETDGTQSAPSISKGAKGKGGGKGGHGKRGGK